MIGVYIIYNLVFTLFVPVLIIISLFIRNNLGRHTLLYRIGFIPDSLTKNLKSGRRRVWIHAVSVGEVNAITTFIEEIKKMNPEVDIIISTMTVTGQKVAREKINEAAEIIYLPFDFIWAARRIMRLISPDVFITIETEIWPNMLREAKKSGASVLMINGRVSPRSITSYMKMKKFIRNVLANYDLMSMIMPQDAERIIDMGAAVKNVQVNGNCKYDHLSSRVNPQVPERVRSELNIGLDEKVFIAGSTRSGEEEKILAVYKKMRLENNMNMVLIIVPRHLNRINEIISLVNKTGFDWILKTDIDQGQRRSSESVIIINTIGELFNIYSSGDIVFCGASLVPKGGQNILEPAAWGKAVFYGPSMEDFLDARALLEDVKAGIEITDEQDFYLKAVNLINHPDQLNQLGQRAKEAVLSNEGASQKNARLVSTYLRG